jgi:tetratricopeptide (TPR) repeat protein
LFQQGTKAALEQALVEWQRALDFYQAVGDRAGEATTLGNVADLYRSQDKLPEALAQINAAIELIEQLRGALQDDNLKTAYFATVQGYYQFKIDLLMQLHRQQPQQGYDGQALATADQGRARVLRELLTEANAQITKDIDPQGQPVRRGFLRLGDLFNLELGAELVVLSACETALGKTIRGEGMIGLTRGLMYAGAPRVVTSLWNINDRATAEFMTQFYQAVLTEGQPPAAALSATQRGMWQQGQSPYLWAAFTLQGEWR